MTTQIFVDNLKCGGCAGTITKQLKSFPEVSSVKVDIENDFVEVDYVNNFPLSNIKKRLASLGYPEKDTVKGFQKISANAKSYISCAIGKINNEN
ncbi:MAG: heavy-metal-associated domain-containing protein [Bacteroidota bacterium]|nr:heavy-metal-associated domain-containing protein [Bacteroidota bacterium]